MTPEQQQEFLSLIPTSALYEEFKKRFDHCIASGMSKRPTEDDPEHFIMSYTYGGAPLICQGLATQLAYRCQKDIDQNTQSLGLDEL